MKYKWSGLKNRPKHKNMLTITFLLSFIFIFMSSCKGQAKKEKENSSGLLISDTTNKPQVNVNVNKQYDKNGKIVKYDSTYSYVYRGSGGTMPLNTDSVFSNFKSYFNMHSPGMFDLQNNNIFFNDSLFKYDFFNDDYFQKRFELNQKLIGDFYKQLDSLKGDYLRRTYPDKQRKRDH